MNSFIYHPSFFPLLPWISLLCFVSYVTFRRHQRWCTKKWVINTKIREGTVFRLVFIKNIYAFIISSLHTFVSLYFFFLCRQKTTCQYSAHQYLPPYPHPLQVYCTLQSSSVFMLMCSLSQVTTASLVMSVLLFKWMHFLVSISSYSQACWYLSCSCLGNPTFTQVDRQ